MSRWRTGEMLETVEDFHASRFALSLQKKRTIRKLLRTLAACNFGGDPRTHRLGISLDCAVDSQLRASQLLDELRRPLNLLSRVDNPSFMRHYDLDATG